MLYRSAKTHRVPYLYKLFSAKEPYNEGLFCGKCRTTRFVVKELCFISFVEEPCFIGANMNPCLPFTVVSFTKEPLFTSFLKEERALFHIFCLFDGYFATAQGSLDWVEGV